MCAASASPPRRCLHGQRWRRLSDHAALTAQLRPFADPEPVSRMIKGGNRLILLENGADYFPALIEALMPRGAKSTWKPIFFSPTRAGALLPKP
jgi:hypothetical protein